MAALASEIAAKEWPHDRLERWGKWARCAALGESSDAAGYLRERLDHAHDTEPTAEIAITDRAVAKVKVARRDYWRVLGRYYLSDRSEYEIALEIGHNIGRVTAMLRQSRMLIGFHILQLEKQEQ
jgi:hypothetical protein